MSESHRRQGDGNQWEEKGMSCPREADALSSFSSSPLRSSHALETREWRSVRSSSDHTSALHSTSISTPGPQQQQAVSYLQQTLLNLQRKQQQRKATTPRAAGTPQQQPSSGSG